MHCRSILTTPDFLVLQNRNNKSSNIHQADAGGLDGKIPMTPQMQVRVRNQYLFSRMTTCNIAIAIKLQAAKMTSLDVFGFDPTAADSDDEPITDVED